MNLQDNNTVIEPMDFRRIMAAWSACEGIPTEALEAGVVKDMLGALKMVGAIIHNGDDPDGSGFFDITAAQIDQIFAFLDRHQKETET